MKSLRLLALAGALSVAACCPGYYPDNDHYHHDAAPVSYEYDRTGPHDYYDDQRNQAYETDDHSYDDHDGDYGYPW